MTPIELLKEIHTCWRNGPDPVLSYRFGTFEEEIESINQKIINMNKLMVTAYNLIQQDETRNKKQKELPEDKR